MNDNWPIHCHFCGSPHVTIAWPAYPGIGWCDNCEPDPGWQRGDPPAYRTAAHMSDDGLIRMSGDTMWNEGYAVGVQDSMLRATQYERILTDLIENLRGAMSDRTLHQQDTYHYCTPFIPLKLLVQRAEAQLREVRGE